MLLVIFLCQFFIMNFHPILSKDIKMCMKLSSFFLSNKRILSALALNLFLVSIVLISYYSFYHGLQFNSEDARIMFRLWIVSMTINFLIVQPFAFLFLSVHKANHDKLYLDKFSRMIMFGKYTFILYFI